MDYAIPQYDGVKVVECKYIPLSDIKRESNSGRESDFNIKKIQMFEKAILTGQYYPTRYEPPMVVMNGDGKYVLKTGFHRYNAHLGTEQKELWVAVVKFSSKRDEIKVRNLENAQEHEVYIKEYRSAADIIKSASELLTMDEEDGVEITEKTIRSVLKELMADKNENYTEIFNSLKENHNIRGGVTGYTYDQVEEFVNNNSTGEYTNVVQLFQGNKITKADERLLMNVLKAKEENGADHPVVVNGWFTKISADKVEEARAKRKPIWEENKKKYIKLLSILTDPKFTDPQFNFMPQLDGVEINVND